MKETRQGLLHRWGLTRTIGYSATNVPAEKVYLSNGKPMRHIKSIIRIPETNLYTISYTREQVTPKGFLIFAGVSAAFVGVIKTILEQ